MKRNDDDQNELVYQCNTCNFVLTINGGDPRPSYCPICAINHLKGKMVIVSDRTKGGPEPMCETYKR